MYFAYGWPKVAFTDLQSGDTYIYLRATEDFLFAVSRTCVQLWTGGLHRLKLSECVRTEEDVKQEGVHMTALWCKAKTTLAVLTSENYLLLYAIHTWKENLVHHSCNTILRDIQKVDIYLSSSIRMDSVSRALSITGDSRMLLVGFADGTVASLSWSGKMKEVAYPLDDVIDPVSFDARADTQPSSLNPGPAAPASMDVAPGSAGSTSAFAAFVGNPATHTLNHTYSGLPHSRAITKMSYCEHSKQVVMVLSDGACAVCGTSEGGLGPLSELCFGRWLCGPQHQAVYAQVGARAQLIAVGRESGEVELYRLHRTAVDSPGPGPRSFGMESGGLSAPSWEPPVRTLSLENWGHKVQQTGAVVQVEWSPDGRAIAVAYSGQGVVVWSPSGCRLMCSLRQPPPNNLSVFPSTASRPGLISHQASNVSRSTPAGGNSARGMPAAGAQQPPGPAPHVPMDGGISALSWGPMGYQLSLGEVGGGLGIGSGSGGALLELTFAHSLAGHHRVARGGLGTSAIDEEMHVLLAHDRLLLIREAGEMAWGGVPWAAGDGTEPPTGQVSDLTVSHLPLPHSYVVSNWPLQRAAISASGSDIAVAGRSGLAVYNRTTERWRLFGDISQERQVSCRALGWLGAGVLVACSGPDPYAPPPPPPPAGSLIVGAAPPSPGGPTGNELLLLPRYHLDLTSLLARHPLQQPPIAMDCLGNHILLASEPLEITLLEVTLQGELSPTGNPRATITTLREISMFDVGRHLSDVALVPLMPLPVSATTPGTATSNGAISASTSASSSAAPKQCVLLRWGGLLSVLDLEKGAELTLATEIEAFWLSDAITCHTGVGSPSSGGVWAGSGSWPSPPWVFSTRESLEGGSPFTTQIAGNPDGSTRGASRAGEGGSGDAAAAQVLSEVLANTAHTTTVDATVVATAPGAGAQPLEGLTARGGGGITVAWEAAGGGVTAGKEAAGVSGTPGGREEGPGTDPFDRAAAGQVVAAAGMGAVAAAAPPPAAATLDVEMPWWLYGPAGMQLCFPSSLGTPMSPSMGFREGHDIELEFDQEVYPVGISLADDAIVGITQRIVRGPPGLLVPASYQLASASQLPCFHPIPESQPVLPCLLRRLLQRGAFHEAVSLARRHARGPHFARSLEWLLFTALEIDTNTSSLARPVPPPAATTSAPGGSRRLSGVPALAGASESGEGAPRESPSKQLNQQSLLSAAADLVRHFPTLFAEVVVSVARKTDAALWPPLFDAVGSPSKLLDGLVEAGELASAACFLLIIDRLEGAHAAQAQALRLMRSSLLRGQYPLCCELLRFVVPPSEQDTDGGRGLGPELSFSQGVGDEGAASDAVVTAGAGRQPAAADSQQPTAGPQPPSNSTPSPESDRQEASAGAEPSTGRSWLGWLLGYGADPVPTPTETNPPESETGDAAAAAPQGRPTSTPPPADGGDASSSFRVPQTLALLGIDSGGSTLAGSGAGLNGSNTRSSIPGSPRRGPATVANTGSGAASGSPALAQLLLGAATAGANSAASAKACRLVAEHAWQLLEAGHVAALGQLVQASNFMPGGLAGLMSQHRESPYAVRGCASFTASELLSALAVAVTELPVWNSEEVEMCAVGVEALCREVGAVAWAVAMAVLLVDVATVTAFRQEQPEVWVQFTSMLQADSSFSYLWDIVEVLSGEGGDKGTPLGLSGGRGETDRQGRDVGPAGTAAGASGEANFALSVSAGHVELRSLVARSKGETGQQQGAPVESGGLATSIPGPVAGEVSIARG